MEDVGIFLSLLMFQATGEYVNIYTHTDVVIYCKILLTLPGAVWVYRTTEEGEPFSVLTPFREIAYVMTDSLSQQRVRLGTIYDATDAQKPSDPGDTAEGARV